MSKMSESEDNILAQIHEEKARKRAEDEERESIRKEYIRSKYANEYIIPKEIFMVYDTIPKEKIMEEIHENCKFCRRVEEPLKEKKVNNLFLIKQYTMNDVLKENGKDVDKIILYKNFVKTYKFHILGINCISRLRTRYWKPAEVARIEDDLRKIPKLSFRSNKLIIPTNTDNFLVIRGYFGSMINLIIIRDHFFRPLEVREFRGEKLVIRDEFTKLKENEFAEIVVQIANVLDARKETIKNRTRIMLVDDNTFTEFRSIDMCNNLFTGEIGYALVCLRSNNREGMLIEYLKEDQKTLELYSNIIFLKQAKDVCKNVDFNKLGKKTKRYKLKDFKKPIIKLIIFSKPKKIRTDEEKKYQYDKLSMFHIMKYLNENDREKLEEIYPDSLNMKIKILSKNDEEETKRNMVNKLFRKLDNLRIK